MAFKLVNATDLRVGGFMMIEGNPYIVKNMDVSKTGKHGHAKCRFEATSIMGGKKKVLVIPGHDRFEVPMILKNKAQVLSIMEDKVSLMDLESFENFELDIPIDLKADIHQESNVEYWDIEGRKIIRRIL